MCLSSICDTALNNNVTLPVRSVRDDAIISNALVVSGLDHPLDMMYHIQPWMLLALTPLSLYFEGKSYNNFYIITISKPTWHNHVELIILRFQAIATTIRIVYTFMSGCVSKLLVTFYQTCIC